VAALSYLLFPTSLITYAQITKDAYSICGGFMFLYGWLLLARWPEGLNRRQVIEIVVLIAGGATVAWVARPYLVEIMMGLSAGFATLVAIRMIVLGIRREVRPIRGVRASVMAWLMVVMLTPFSALGADMYLHDSPPSAPDAASPSGGAVSVAAAAERPSVEAAGPSGEVLRQSAETERRRVEVFRRRAEILRRPGEAARGTEAMRRPGETSEEAARRFEAAARRADEAARRFEEAARRPSEAAPLSGKTVPPSWPADTLPAPLASPVPATRPAVPWSTPWWVPSAIDNRMYSLAMLRYRWTANFGRSTVDQDVMPANLKEVVAYLPRLMAVGFLAPFPDQWFEKGSFGSTTMMRRAVGVEMVLTYVAFVGLALGVRRWRARLELWFVLAYGGVTTLIWAYIVLNIGSLHRARFGFLMVLVALGFAGILSSLRLDRTPRASA